MPQFTVESDCLLVFLDAAESTRWRGLDWAFRAAALREAREGGLERGAYQFVIRDASGNLDSGFSGAVRAVNPFTDHRAELAGPAVASVREMAEESVSG